MNAANLSRLIKISLSALIKSTCLFIWGSTGCGKTTLAADVARLCDVQFFSFNSPTMYDPSELRGGIVNQMSKDGKYRMTYSIPEMIAKLEEGPSVLFFDEFPRTPQMTMGAIMPVFTSERRLGIHKIPDNCLVIAAGNPPNESYFGNELDLAQAVRFTHISFAPSNQEVLTYLAEEKDVQTGILAYFEKLPEALHAPLLPIPFKPKATPRNLEAAGEWFKAMSEAEFNDMGYEVFEGLLGEHTNGVIQSIKNNLEMPIPYQQLISGEAEAKLKSWTGNMSRIGLLVQTLKGMHRAVAADEKDWNAFQTRVCGKNGKGIDADAVEPFAKCLALFPADVLRKHVKELNEKAKPILSQMVINSTKDNGKAYPHSSEFVKIMQELRRSETELEDKLTKKS